MPRNDLPQRAGKFIGVGDVVGVTVAVLNKQREIVGHKVVARGIVLRIHQHKFGAWYRADIDWFADSTTAFLYTGKEGWAYLNEVTLLKRAKVPTRKRRSLRD
jgi:hypothetical protein